MRPTRILFSLLLLLVSTLSFGCAAETGDPSQKVLIVQDEIPQMEVLSDFLTRKGELTMAIVEQAEMPDDLSNYRAVLVFIHGDLREPAEKSFIDYTRNGGRLVVLHHSISSGKAVNDYYFDFLGIRLDNPDESAGPVEPGGGYGWRHQETDGSGVTLTLVNLQPEHYITTHEITWPDTVTYTPSDFPSVERTYPSISLEDSEVYLNHKFTDGRAKTVLLGFKYYDDRVDHLFMQDRAGWIKKQGSGEVVYLMPGQNASDYENARVAQMVLNAVQWKP